LQTKAILPYNGKNWKKRKRSDSLSKSKRFKGQNGEKQDTTEMDTSSASSSSSSSVSTSSTSSASSSPSSSSSSSSSSSDSSSSILASTTTASASSSHCTSKPKASTPPLPLANGNIEEKGVSITLPSEGEYQKALTRLKKMKKNDVVCNMHH